MGFGIAAAAIPMGVSAYLRYRDSSRRAQLSDFVQTGDPEYLYAMRPAAFEEEEENASAGAHEEVWDDALQREMARRNYYGPATPQLAAQVTEVARQEAARWEPLLPRAPEQAGGVEPLSLNTPGKAWVNLGPTDARFQFNGTEYLQVDSGRTTGILMHPANPDIVYTATSGGGIWKTFNFTAKNPTWYPITETVGNTAIGNIAMDPNDPETIYAGLGDFVDVPGGQVIKTTNGGITWSSAVSMMGTLPGTSTTLVAQRVRSVVVDPTNTSVVMVGTDVGLFRSADGGQSFAFVDLPNAGAPVAESVWSIVYTGAVNGVSRWALSSEITPAAAGGGDVWTSNDGGVTWASRKAAGGLPNVVTSRIDMAAGTASANAATTVIYAQVADAARSNGVAIWRSTDSGNTFVDATGTLRNPTTSTACRTQLVQAGQAFYNQTVAVDPANNNNVLIGGTLCGVRALNGLAASPTWELISHWLPSSNSGQTADGRLPYVHADWHRLAIVRPSTGGYIAIAGTDGGLYVSRNVFTTSAPTDTSIRWDYPNRGIVSHLFYHIASGEPTLGNPFLAYGGLQDNGTRFRDGPDFPTTFNQVIGGDGIGSAAAEVPGDRIYWGSVQSGSLRLCDPDTMDCNRGENWFGYRPQNDFNPLPCAGDGVSGQFLTRVLPVRTATAATGPAVITVTDRGMWRYRGDPFFSDNSWELLGNLADTTTAGACHPGFHRNIGASIVNDGLLGAPLNGGRYRITSNCTLTTPAVQCTWSLSNPLGVDLNSNGTVEPTESMLFTSSIDFPPGPTGKPLGDVYVVASVAPLTAANTSIPDTLGRLFITEDRGQTWRPLKGNGTSDLPNLPIDVVRYDPSDLTNNTLYVGNYIGVYRTTDGGQTWQRFGAGMPMVRVSDLWVSKTGSMLRVATYGRGLWEIYPSATAEKGVNGNGDWDRNQVIDFNDVLAITSRMGTSPATTAAPYYDWNLDVTGRVNGIDDSDLSAVMQRLGGRP